MPKNTEEKTRIDGKLSSEKYEELKEYIDENKDTRRHSKQFYLEKITELALSLKRQREEQERQTHQEYKELRKDVKDDLGI